jgi:hypothetical protein
MTQLINEAKRFQELAGINEVKIVPLIDFSSFLNHHKNKIIDAISNNEGWISNKDINNAKNYYIFEELDDNSENNWYVLVENMDDYTGYSDPRSANGFENIYLAANYDDFAKDFENAQNLDADDDEIPLINPIKIAGRTLYYSLVSL